MITIVELAKLAGVSDATVSLVLAGKAQGRVGEARRQQILALAEEHGYRVNPAARALAQGRSNRIGLCLAGTLTSHAIIGEFSLHERLGLFAEGIQQAGYSLEIIQTDPKQSPADLSLDLRRRAVDGLVFLDWPADLLQKPLRALCQQGVPAVASGTTVALPGSTWTDDDSRAVFEQVVQQLQAEGRRQIALVDTVITVMEAEFGGYFKAAMRRWAQVPARECIILQPQPCEYQSLYDATLKLLKSKPELQALFIPDNYLAQAVLNAAQAAGRQPGADLRVIGYGDTVFADQCHPRLSHYSRRIEEQVRFGLEALLEQIEHPDTYEPRHANLVPEYVPRQT